MTATPNPTIQALKEEAVDVGRKIARKVFERRGNHSEAHLSELELATICAFAAEQGMAAAMLTVREPAGVEGGTR